MFVYIIIITFSNLYNMNTAERLTQTYKNNISVYTSFQSFINLISTHKVTKIHKDIFHISYYGFISQSSRARAVRTRITHKYECKRTVNCTSWVSLFKFSIICILISWHQIIRMHWAMSPIHVHYNHYIFKPL